MEKSPTFINRAFNLRPGDFARGLPLFAYYLLIITFYVMGQIARAGIFLDHFKAVRLPYADISVAVLAGFVIAPYIRAGLRTSLHTLQTASLLFFTLNLLGFWWGLHYQGWAWLSTVFYVWVGVCGVLTVAQVWTLANAVWTTREAKRLFSLLGSGGIIGGSVGGIFAKSIISRFGTDAVLLFMAALLPICAVLIQIIWKQKQAAQEEPGVPDTREAPRSMMDSFRLVRHSSHLKAIAALICLSSVVTTLGKWQLNAIAKETLVHKDAISAYLATITTYTGIASLIAQMLITTKVLRRFGVGVALLVLPLSLTMGSAAILVWGTLWAATVFKVSDGVFRYSIDTSALQLLYLPVSPRIKNQVKSFIDTVIWKFGDGLAGVTVLILASYPHFTPSRVSWVSLVLLSVWFAAAFVARRQYVATLRDNIQHIGIRPEQMSLPVLDVLTEEIFAEKLTSTDVDEVLYALSLFEMEQRPHAHPTVRTLLDHPTAQVRAKAISILNAAGDISVLPRMANSLQDESLEVRTEALAYLSRHDHIDPLADSNELGRFPDVSIRSATVAFLANPGEAQNIEAAQVLFEAMVKEQGPSGEEARLAAAQLIGELPDYFEASLNLLLHDSNADVVRHAIRATAILRRRQCVPVLIECLGNPAISTEAQRALATFEDTIIGALRDHLCDPQLAVAIRREIPRVLLTIGTPAAAGVLLDCLLQSDIVVRYRIISALNKLHELHKDLPIDKELIETVMIAEIMGHYRSYQILGSLGGHKDTFLEKAMNWELERIFRMMKLLFPDIDFQNAYRGIQSKDPVTHANALEFLDNTMHPRLRTLLLPIIDTDVSLQERIARAEQLLHSRVNTNEEAVAALFDSEDPWLKSCAAYAVGKLGLKTFEAELDLWSRHPDPLLQKRIEDAKIELHD